MFTAEEFRGCFRDDALSVAFSTLYKGFLGKLSPPIGSAERDSAFDERFLMDARISIKKRLLEVWFPGATVEDLLAAVGD